MWLLCLMLPLEVREGRGMCELYRPTFKKKKKKGTYLSVFIEVGGVLTIWMFMFAH